MATFALPVSRVVLAAVDMDTLPSSFPHAFLSLLLSLTVKYKGKSSSIVYKIYTPYQSSIKISYRLYINLKSHCQFSGETLQKKNRIKNFCARVVDVDSFKAEETKDFFKTFLLWDTNVF